MMKKAISILLVIIMVLTLPPVSAMAGNVNRAIDRNGEIIAFAPLTETEKQVMTGTSLAELKLPNSLTATIRVEPVLDSDTRRDSAVATEDPDENEKVAEQVSEGSDAFMKAEAGELEKISETAGPEWEESIVDIPVTWISNPEYDMNSEGEYVFTPVIENYRVSAVLPEITVRVSEVIPSSGARALLSVSASITVTSEEELQAAILNVTDGGTIILGDDISLHVPLEIADDNTKNFTLNLNGKTLDSGSLTTIRHEGSGTLTIDDTNNGELKSFTNDFNSGSNATIELKGGSLVVKKGTVSNKGGSRRVIDNSGTGSVSVTGGLVKGPYGIYNSSSGKVSVSGGVVESTVLYGIFNEGTGEVDISGGTVKNAASGAAICLFAGQMTVSNDALITSANSWKTEGTIILYTSVDVGLVLAGGIIENTADNGIGIYSSSGSLTSVVSGTTIVRGKGKAMSIPPKLEENIQIKAGQNYDGLNAFLISEEALENSFLSNNVYIYLKFEPVPKPKEVVATIGETGYSTLQDAVNEVGTNETIELKKELSENITIENDCSFTLNLNGKRLKGDGGSAIVHKGKGTLTITDSRAGENGKITGDYEGGTIILNSGSLVVQGGIVESRASSGAAIINSGRGVINVTDCGLVTSSCTAISNQSTGDISIDGGLVESISADHTICNHATGSINVTGGTVKNTGSGAAVFNNADGQVSIGGDAVVTSVNPTSTQGTILLSGGLYSVTVLTIAGGTIENSADGGIAIYNGGSGKIAVLSGVTIVRGKGMAMNTEPGLSAYRDGRVIASAEYAGTPTSSYSKTNITAYKFLCFEQRVAAQIGDKSYQFLQDAFDAVGEGQTIKLLNDISLTASVTIPEGSKKNCVLDLNGKTLNCWLTAIVHNGSGTLTIIDSSTNSAGKISSGQYQPIWLEGGSLVVAGGTVENRVNMAAISNNGSGNVSITGGTVKTTFRTIVNQSSGSVTVTGGTVLSTGNCAIYNFKKGKIIIGGTAVVTSTNSSTSSGTIYQEEINDSEAEIRITGGTIENTSENGYAVYTNSKTPIIISDGFPVIKAKGTALNKAPDLSNYLRVQVTASENFDGSLPVAEYKKEDIAKYKYLKFSNNDVAQIGQTRYATLQSAINGLTANNQTIQLIKNTSENINILGSNAYSFVLDLNGKVLDGKLGGNTTITHAGSGTLTVTDTSEDGNGRITSQYAGNSTGTIFLNGGSLVVEKGKVESTCSLYPIAIRNAGSGSISVSGGTVEAPYIGIYNDSTSTLTISGGTVNASGVGPSSIGAGSDGTGIFSRGPISIPSGWPIIMGKGSALNVAPDLSGYGNVYVKASKNYNGSSPVTYEASKVTDYKYLAFAPVVGVTHLDLTEKLSVPVVGGAPIKNIVDEQYNGTVTWNGGNPTKFLGNTVYTATVVLTAKDNYTFSGIVQNAFTCTGAAGITSDAGTGTTITVTVVFPPTEKENGPAAPSVGFSFDGVNANKLVGATTLMEYSLDGGSSWTDCTTDLDLTAELNRITVENGLKVRMKETTTRYAGAIKTIEITQAPTPTVDKTDETRQLNDGTIIGVNQLMEYKKKGETNYSPISGSTITGLAPGQYLVRIKATGTQLASPDFLVEIVAFAKKTPEVTDLIFDLSPVTYDGNPKPVLVTAVSGKNMGPITVKYNGNTSVPVNAGNYRVTVDIDESEDFKAVTGLELGRYIVNKATVAVTPSISMNVDVSDDGTQTVNIAEQVAPYKEDSGTLTYTFHSIGGPNSGAVRNPHVDEQGVLTFTTRGFYGAGKTATISVQVSNLKNYNDILVTVTVTLTAKEPQEISYPVTNVAKTYGDGKFITPLTQTTVNGPVSYLSDDPAVAMVDPSTGEVTILGYGRATITATAAETATHAEAKASYTVTVAKKALTLEADDKSMTKGEALPAFTYTATGLVNGDTVTTSPGLSSVADGTVAGTFPITIGGGVVDKAENYDITYRNGILTVAERLFPVTVTGGTGSGSYAEGATVTITAHEKNGYTFTGWNSDDVIFTDGSAKTTTFIMPGKAVTVTANYRQDSSGGNGESGGSSGGDSGRSGSSLKSDSPNVIITEPKLEPDGTTQVEIQLSGTVNSQGNVTVNLTDKAITDAYNKALAETQKNGNEQNGITVVLHVETSSRNVSSVNVNLPKDVQDTIIAKRIVNTILIVDNPDIEISLDLDAVEEISKQARTDVNVTATRTDSSKLTGDAEKAIGNRPAFDLKMNYGSDRQVKNFGDGRVTVTIPYTLGENEQAENICAVYIDENGKLHWLTDSVYDSQEKALRFSTNHFSTYGVGYREKENLAFTDIADHWARESIEFVVSQGLFSGTSAGTFSPNLAMTRGMFVTVLGKLAGAEVNSYRESSFSDVQKDAYYLGYIEWANKEGIVKGTGSGKFAPDQPITREQMAVIMKNYADNFELTLPNVKEENIFVDSSKISSYAEEAVKLLQMAGILNGKNGNLFDPQGTATRAEVSTVLSYFVKLINSGDLF